jgi:hypothetical protein
MRKVLAGIALTAVALVPVAVLAGPASAATGPVAIKCLKCN